MMRLISLFNLQLTVSVLRDLVDAKSPLPLTTKVVLSGRIPLPISILALRMTTCLLLFLKVKVNFANVEARW